MDFPTTIMSGQGVSCGVKEATDFDKALQEARAFLRVAGPFFAGLLGTGGVASDSKIPTACVNEAGLIRINPDFFLSLGVTERATLLAHEIMHPAWGVFWRAKTLEHDALLSNIAHDHVVNLIISNSYPGWAVPGWLCDERFGGMSYEEVYELVKKESRGGGRQKTIPGPGQDVLPEGGGLIDIHKEEAQWRERVIGAFQAARAMGSVPSEIERAVSEMLDPEVDWRDKLVQAVSDELGRMVIDWGCPGRRSDGVGVHTPAESSLGHDVSVAVDTSGSISAENLKRACAEILAIVEEAGGAGRFLVGDAAVHKDMLLREFDASGIVGGGGTSFAPIFQHLEEHPTRMLIYFTDTFGTFPEEEPGYPVIWAVYQSAAGRAQVPFGEVVIIPDE